MKDLNTYITEKFKIRKSNKPSYKYFPETKKELQDLLNQLIKERGNEGDFNDIDTSKITDMSGLFDNIDNDNRDKFNGDISNWDVSNVTDMYSIFYGCKSFNQPLNNWDVSNVKSMVYMFYKCKSFNQDISNWDVSNVRVGADAEMFDGCPIKEKYKPKFK